MTVEENFCRLCGDSLESYVEFGSLVDLSEVNKMNLPLTPSSKICLTCFEFINKIQKFIENSHRVDEYLTFVSSNFTNLDDLTLKSTRSSFGLSSRSDQSTDTSDLFEILEPAADHSYEIEQFQEITDNTENYLIEDENIVVDKEELRDEDFDEEMKSEIVKIERVGETEEVAFEEFDYACHICGENFKNFFNLLAHTRKNHDCLPKVDCPCGATLSSRSQIHHHRKIHTSSKCYTCDLCDKVYTHQQSLQNHMKKCHTETQKAFECSKCCKSLDSERKLKIHEQSHLPDDKKLVHPCPVEGCTKKFSKSVNVQAHVKAIHSKERPFLCSGCGKNFCTKGALKEHQIIHSDQFPYACSFCDKRFKNQPRLKTHEDTHGVTQYICNVCGISLNTKRTLKMHMVVHSDLKRFKCEFCSSSFKRSKALKNHLILHSGLRPYSCPFCGKTFANGSNCRSHKKKAHPRELAAFEAAGNATTTPNIPRLEQLMQKGQQDEFLIVDSSGMILQEITTSESKADQLASIVIQSTDNYQIIREN